MMFNSINRSFGRTIAILTALVMLFSGFPTEAFANHTIFPSSNDVNKTKSWAHVNVLDDTVPGEITLEFVSTRAFNSCFEYRTDGDTSEVTAGTNDNVGVHELYPYKCVNNSTDQITLEANQFVEVRMVFGAEGDERFDWTKFDVLPVPIPTPACDATDTVDNTTFDTFTLGDVDGQKGWSATGPYDQAIVENTYGYNSFGCKSLRVSDAITSGSFGDWIFSAPTAAEAGESGVASNNRYEVEFDIASAVPDAQQDGLQVSVSPDGGDGSRMSYLGFSDESDGIHVTFNDVENTGPLPKVSSFNATDIATLDRDIPHTIKLTIDFVDGPGDDIVNVYIDGVLEHTGTSWEDYYRFDGEQTGNGNEIPAIDSLIIQARSSAGPNQSENNGKGFLFDNLSLVVSDAPVASTSSEKIEVTGNTAAAENDPGGWLFNRDANTDTPFEFNEEQAVIGDGSLYVLPIGANAADKFIGELFLHKLVDDVESISYDYRLGDGVNAGKANEFYANAYVNFDDSDDYGHCVYDIVPTDGSAGWHTMTFDPSLDYPVRQRGSAPAGSTCPSSPSDLPAEAELRMFAINLGDSSTSDMDVDGYFDNVVTVVDEGASLHTTTYDFEPIETATVTMCKLHEDDTPLAGWTLMLRSEHIEDLDVPVNSAAGIDSGALMGGLSYIAEVVGTWLNARGPDNHVDAEYSTEDNWVTHVDGFTGRPAELLELRIDGAFGDWGPYSSDHTYARSFIPAASGPVNFSINDTNYQDNSGSLDVAISEGYAGVTGADGCVVFNDVPYGTYEAAEILKNGWFNISGLETVTVDADEERFDIVNTDEAPVNASLTITDPAADGATLSGTHTFKAEYVDNDNNDDPVQWAIRAGTCSMGTGNVAGNVAGFNTPFTWDGADFSATVDMSSWDDGEYCLVVNPTEDSGVDFRETRTFTLDNPDPVACVAGDNLLANASFEEPVINQSWSLVTPVAWIVKTLGGDDLAMEIQRGVNGWDASHGEQHVELDSTESSVISQIIPTVLGATYRLSWDFSPRPNTLNTNNKLEVLVNNLIEATNDGAGGGDVAWNDDFIEFKGTGADMEIAFRDAGNSDALGTLLDNVELVCEPTPSTGPYCGDGTVNQGWEQCDGTAGCTNYCLADNQCHATQLAKITLSKTDSVSFDGQIYLGSKDNTIPSGVWFNLEEVGDDLVNLIADEVDGLAVERDHDDDTLKIAFFGGNARKDLDEVTGTLELLGARTVPASISRGVIGTSYQLENTAPAFIDIFNATDNTHMSFQMKTDVGNDGVTIPLLDDEDYGQCLPEGNTDPDPNEHVLTITLDPDPEAGGKILGEGLNCDSALPEEDRDCTVEFSTTTDIELTAVPDDNSNFDSSWTVGAGGCTGNASPCTVTVDKDLSLTAHFGFGPGGNTFSARGTSGGGNRISLIDNSDDDDGPNPRVAGAQTSIIPTGAPNAGFGGADAATDTRSVYALLALIAAIGIIRKIIVNARTR